MSAPPGYSKGLIPRDFSKQPHGSLMYAKPFTLPLIPQNEWAPRWQALKAANATMMDVRMRSGPNGGMIPSRDQNGKGYCWAHSAVSAMLLRRAMDGEPYADLSAYEVACIIKDYQDEGGWGGDAVEWISQNGITTSQFWPQKSMNRSNDNAAMRADSALRKYTEWMDLDPSQMKEQYITCVLLGIPLVHDSDAWGHSIAGIGVTDDFSRPLIWNSWGDDWKDNGVAVPDAGNWPDACLACLTATPSAT